MSEIVTPQPPASIKIGSIVYDVTIDQARLDAASVAGDSDAFAGMSQSTTQSIVLADGMGPDYTRDTLLHEILHQCLRASSIDPDADAKAGVQDIEERTVAAISGHLLETLRSNPEVVAFLVDTKKN